MIEIKVKNIDLNIEKEIRFLLANENKHLLDCEIEETDDECIFKFDDEGIYRFESVDTLSKEEKYRLLVNIADIDELSDEYAFCLAPSNIVYDINLIPKILVRDKRMGEPDFYIQYKALVSSVLYNKYTFEQYIGGSAKVSEKSFIKNIDGTKSLKEELLKRYLKERETNINTKVQVKKSEYKKLKLSLNVHPADGIRAYEDAYPAVAKRLGLDAASEEAAIFDIADPRFRESYFKDVHYPLEEQGVDFWWIDWQQGTQGVQDPLWLLNHYHYVDNCKRKDGGLILSRYAGPGSHRYPVGFSGDAFITWESLKFQPYFTSTASNIGYSWWSHDIGGHMGGYYDEELQIRWLQYGVFSPITRLHSTNSPFNSKEPWFFTKNTAEIMKHYLRLRHQLLPYLYTMNVATHEEGAPLVSPMYYFYPENEESYRVPNQYFFGSELMVAPITEPMNKDYQSAKVQVWFPEGKWYDFFTGREYAGEVVLDIYRDIESIPVFAKEGAIVPLDGSGVNMGVDLPEVIDWYVFPGTHHSFDMVEDLDGARCVTTLSVDWNLGTIQLTVEGETGILPVNRIHRVHVQGSQDVVVELENKNATVEFTVGEKQTVNRNEAIFQVLKNAHLPYETKEHLYRRLVNAKDANEIINILHHEDDELRGRLLEILFISEP